MSVTSQVPAAIMAELVTLREERDRLARLLAERRGDRWAMRIERTIRLARTDALGLLTIAAGGGTIARDYSPLPQRRWAYAIALLRLAGIARGRDARLRLGEPATLMKALDRAAEVAIGNPLRFGRLIPPSVAPGFLKGLPTQRQSKRKQSPGEA